MIRSPYRCGGHAAYSGPCGAYDCDDCHPGGYAELLEEREREAREPEPVAFRCVSDLYDPDGSVPYDTVAEFLDMCRVCFGSAPELRADAAGNFYDERGVVVLEPVEAQP